MRLVLVVWLIMEATFSPEEAHIIWMALRHSQALDTLRFMNCYPSPEAKDRHAEAMRLVAHELRKIGIFPPLPKHSSDAS